MSVFKNARAVLGLAALLSACSSSQSALPSFAIDPSAIEAAPGATIQFNAMGGDNHAVAWSVAEPEGGTVDPDGVYTAPATTGTYHVVATSTSDPSASATSTVTVTTTPTPPPPQDPGTSTGTGGRYAPSYSGVTGGGAMPSTDGAPVASCPADGSTDATSCLQGAIDGARSAGKPLLIPAGGSYYRITSALNVTTSLIGTNGTPTIRMTSTCGTPNCSNLRLAQGMTGWIYNLHLVGTNGSGGSGEYAHNISVGGVNGVTIKGNYLEVAQGDAVADHSQSSDSATSSNVLVDGNTIVDPYRCALSLVNVSDRWAFMNNLVTVSVPYVSTVDIEPWQASSYVTNVEVGYNKFTTPANQAQTNMGNYVGVVTATGWFDANPGGNVWAHHNYGSWPFGSFVYRTLPGGGGAGGVFSNVVDVSNVQGDAPAP